jgi:hypothetical protein
MQALESYVLGGALMAGKTPGERADWWKELQEDGCPLEQELHAIQLSRQLTSRDLEMAMTASLRRQGLNASLIRLYEQHLARIPDCGSEFFEEALRYSLKSRSAALLEELWNATRLDAQTEERTRQLLSAADQQITMNESQENAALVRFVDEHAAGQSWPHTDVYQFLSRMTAKSSIASLLHRPQSVILPAWQKANPQFTVFPVNQDLPSRRGQQAVRQLQQRGFAAAVRPQQADDPAGFNIQVYTVQCLNGAKALGQFSAFKYCHVPSPFPPAL